MRERIVAIIGSTGSGKTTKLAELIRQQQRLIIVDPTCDESLERLAVPAANMDEAERLTRSPQFHIRWSGQRNPVTFDGLCWLALQRGNCLLAVDEIHLYVKKTSLGIPKYFQECCLIGRHSGVAIIVTSQRPALTHNDYLSQVQKWFVFQIRYPEDSDALKKLIPNVADSHTFKVGEFLTFPAD